MHRGRQPRSLALRQRGFTLIEAAVVIAIIGAVAAAAWISLGRLRPRSHLSSAASELQALVHGARLTALSTGHDVAVLVFPAYAGPDSAGRVVVYEDGNYDFFSATGAVNFDAYDPAVKPAGSRSQVLATFDLPLGVTFGPADGMGVGATLPAPLSMVDVTKACSFCGSLSDGRGAIKYDSRGRVSFYGRNGAPLLSGSASPGGSLSLTAAEVTGQRTVVITPTVGSVRVWNNG